MSLDSIAKLNDFSAGLGYCTGRGMVASGPGGKVAI